MELMRSCWYGQESEDPSGAEDRDRLESLIANGNRLRKHVRRARTAVNGETVHVPQALEDPLRCVPLLAQFTPVRFRDDVEMLAKPSSFGHRTGVVRRYPSGAA